MEIIKSLNCVFTKINLLAIFAAIPLSASAQGVLFERDFSPAQGIVKPAQADARAEICLNGLWDFQPVNIPSGYKFNTGNPPELAEALPDKWESVKIKIPSPWNVNDWGGGQATGEGTNRPYAPSSVYFPSYPKNWVHARMGWLKKDFELPKSWLNGRVMLHFDAIAGDAKLYINGELAGEHFDQHMGVTFDITKFVKEGKNELKLGIRHSKLFDKSHPKYKMNATYPAGSNTDDLVGVWQDVFLMSYPQTYVEDIFAKPLVSKDELEFEVTLKNASQKDFSGEVSIDVKEWINGAYPAIKKARTLKLDDGAPLGKRAQILLDAAEPKWSLAKDSSLSIAPVKVALKAGQSKTFTLKTNTKSALKFWTHDTPNLYAALVNLSSSGKVCDVGFARFGWREFKIDGDHFTLNGKKIQFLGDLQHPFGPYITSRRFVYGWYELIKAFGGNAVRPHAQPWPKYYYDMADELGLMVLAEDGLFGSSIRPNLTEDITWLRTSKQIESLVKRYRNNPSVAGWSVGNEMFAMSLKHLQIKNFEKFRNVRNPEKLNDQEKSEYEQFKADEAQLAKDTEVWTKKLADLAKIPAQLDSTRPFITIDGDGDLNGNLAVWSKHFGDGDRSADIQKIKSQFTSPKPIVIGEFGATYYGMPNRIYKYAGDAVYKSYDGRNEALAVDLYQNYRDSFRENLAYFSPSEICWFAVKHLPFGYKNFERLPDLSDGIFPQKPYKEGKAGYQFERIPPYIFTVNAGLDKSLAMFEPLALFKALKAAIANAPCKWDNYELLMRGEPQAFKDPKPAQLPAAKFKDAEFIGNLDGTLAKQLRKRGVNLGGKDSPIVFVDGSAISQKDAQDLKAKIAKRLSKNPDAVLFVMFGKSEPSPALKEIFKGFDLLVNPYRITALEKGTTSSSKYFNTSDIYFSEEKSGDKNRLAALSALSGNFLKNANTVFKASNIDWSLFDAPEKSKCAQVVLYESMKKPASAVCVEKPLGKGKLVLSTLNYNLDSRRADMLFKTLFRIYGLATSKGEVSTDANSAAHDLLMDGPID